MEHQNYLNSVNLNQNTDFPYLVLRVVDDNSYPRNPGFQVMHWHEDLQFIYLLSGEIEVITLDTRTQLHTGEGIFINKSVVHFIKRNASCRYNSFIFPDYFLKFYFGCPAGSAVEQLVGTEKLPIFHIENREGNKMILDALQRLAHLEQNKTPLYTYEVMTTLCMLWLAFCRVAALPQAAPRKNIIGERMAVFLRYIEQHYQDAISLDALAESAHVSKSECLRCFKAALQTAPYQYLMEYRLAKAAELLRGTNVPISEIATRVGFGQTSHFGKCFREKTNMTPREYRKTYKS